MITILGRIPSKKNSTWNFISKGRIIRLPSQKHKEWHKDGMLQLTGQKAIPTPCSLTISFWFPDARKTDLSNKAESIMDLLVDYGILPDDNCVEIPTLLLVYKGIDRTNPRAEITWQIYPTNQS